MTPSFNKDLSKIMASIVPTDASAYGKSTIQVGSDKKVQPKKSSFSSAGSTILDLLTGEYAKNQPWSKNDEKDTKDSKKISDPIVKKLDEIKNILKQVLQKTKDPKQDSKQEAKKEAEKLFKQKSQTYENRTVARSTQPSVSITPTTSIVTKSVATEQKIPTGTNQDKPEESKDEPTDGRNGLFDFLTDKTKGVGKTAGKVLRKTGDLFKKINPGVLKGGAAALGGLALGAGATKLKESGYEKLGGATDIASDALTWGGTGAALGSVIPGVGTAIGAGVGAVAGGAYGLYKNWNNIFGSKTDNVKSASETNTKFNTKFSEHLFAQNNFESYKLFKKYESEQYEKHLKSKNISEEEAQIRAKNDAVTKFKKEIEASGAETVKTEVQSARSMPDAKMISSPEIQGTRSMPDAKMISSEVQGARSASMLGKDINKMSVENRALEREAQTPQVAQPIVSNNVVSNNTQSIVPIKAQTRVESSFSDYMRRTAAY